MSLKTFLSPTLKDVPFCWGLNITLKGFLDDDDDDDDDGFSSTEKQGDMNEPRKACFR